ncbi:MAG: BatA and WFA domain-containing protein [Ignavibacteria bacterium]|nr:BatA and WFA domain-containing protein [Ignavibacteria bacterium]
MHFINPWYLLGLVFAAIPIVIHLLIIRKNKLVEFSSLRFLKELQKSQIRKLKLKQLLLLILRTLIIVFLILSFARPVVRSDFPLFRNYANISAVVILDNSYSMDISDEYGSRFRQAKNIVTNLLEQFKEGDQVNLILTSESANNLEFTTDYKFLIDEVARANVSVIPASYENSLRLAQKILDKSKNYVREVFLISDFQKSNLVPFADSTRLFDNQTTLNLFHIGAKSKISIENISIDSVIPLTKVYEIGKQIDFEVYLSNYSNKNLDNLVLSLFINGERTAQRLFTILAKSKQKVIIGGTIKNSGVNKCTFEIENDALDYDNKRWIGFIVPDIIKVGHIGAKESGFVNTFFKSLDNNKIKYVYIPNYELSKTNLSDFNTLVVEDLPTEQDGISSLRDYINSGMGFLLFPPNSGNVSLLNNFFNSLNINLTFYYKTFAKDNPPVFTFVDQVHPLFANVFTPPKEGNVVLPEQPKITNFVTSTSGITVVQTTGGQFLTEFNIEGSKILFCGVAPNLDWGNFPFTSLFPVVLHRSILYLSKTNEYNYLVNCGQPLTLSFPKGLTATNLFKLEDPLRNEMSIQSVHLPSGNIIELRDLNLLGTYTLKNSEGKPIGTISVNVDSKESMLDLADKEQILSYFEKIVVKDTKVNFIDETKRIKSESFREYAGTELWKLFLILTLITAGIEMFVARTTKNEMEV